MGVMSAWWTPGHHPATLDGMDDHDAADLDDDTGPIYREAYNLARARIESADLRTYQRPGRPARPVAAAAGPRPGRCRTPGDGGPGGRHPRRRGGEAAGVVIGWGPPRREVRRRAGGGRLNADHPLLTYFSAAPFRLAERAQYGMVALHTARELMSPTLLPSLRLWAAAAAPPIMADGAMSKGWQTITHLFVVTS